MRFSKIKDNDVVNGIGITMSLWTQGCPHHCKGCFNQETWSYEDGEEFINSHKQYIIENIDKNNVKRDLSILGGEPLCPQNIDKVIELCKEFKEIYPQKKIYIWSGYEIDKFTEKQREVLKYIDILIDGQFEQQERNISLKLRGSNNQRIIDISQTIKNNKIIQFNIE